MAKLFNEQGVLISDAMNYVINARRHPGRKLVITPDHSDFPGFSDGKLHKGDMNYFVVDPHDELATNIRPYVMTTFDGDPIETFILASDAIEAAMKNADQVHAEAVADGYV